MRLDFLVSHFFSFFFFFVLIHRDPYSWPSASGWMFRMKWKFREENNKKRCLLILKGRPQRTWCRGSRFALWFDWVPGFARALDSGQQLALPDALQIQVTVVILTVKQNRQVGDIWGIMIYCAKMLLLQTFLNGWKNSYGNISDNDFSWMMFT